MGRRIGFVALGLLAAWAPLACGDDSSAPEPSVADGGAGGSTGGRAGGNEAGDAGDASAGTPSAGAGGTASGAGGEPSEGGRAGDGGRAGEGGGGAGGDGSASMDVHGVVQGYEWPIANAIVVVSGSVTQTDARGRFTVEDAPERYQLIVALPDFKLALVYEDVSTRAPRAQFSTVEDPSYPYAAVVRGQVTGPSGAALTDDWVSISMVTPGQRRLTSAIAVPPEGFELKPSWIDTPRVDAQMWAVQTDDADTVLSFARRNLVIEDGSVYGDVDGSPQTDLELDPVTSKERDLELTVAEGWKVKGASFIYGPLLSRTGIKAAGQHKVKVPEVDAAVALNVDVEADDGAHGNLALEPPATGTWKFSVPGRPQPLSPAAGANAVTKDTVFSWTKPTGFLTNVAFEVDEWTIYLASTKTQSKIPDLSALGVAFNGTLSGTWGLYAVGPATTVEEQMELEQDEYSEAYHRGPWGFIYDPNLREFGPQP